MTLYFIRNKKTRKYLSVHVSSNGEEAKSCNEYSARFGDVDFHGSLYHTTSYATAERALAENPQWYNSSLETPEWMCNMDSSDYEIVEVTLPE
jgi:hypothetical protein